MKKITLFLSFVLLSFVLQSQCFSQSRQLADRYWDQAEQLKKQGNYLDAAEMYVKSAEAERSSSKPRFGYLSEEFGSAGLMYKSIGQNHEAMSNFRQALLIDRKLRRDDYIATDLSNIGDIYQSWGQHDEAIKNYKQAVVLDRKLGRDDYVAINLNNIGVVYQSLGQYDTAIEYFEQALAIDRKLGGHHNIAIRLNNIGMVYREQGKYDKAIDYLKQALVINKKLGEDESLAKRLNNIGVVYQAMGQYDTAIDHFEQALVIDRKLGRDRNISIRLNNIGMAYQALGQYNTAIDSYEQALIINKKLGRDRDRAGILDKIGTVYQSSGQYDTAINNFKQALVIHRKLGRTRYIAVSLNSIGMGYQALGQYDAAIRHYKEALAIDGKLGRESNIATYLNNIGAVYQAWGNYDTAIRHYEQALAIYKKLAIDGDIAKNLNNIGMVYYSWGQYDKAIISYKQAVAIGKKLGSDGDIALYLSNMGGVYHAWGQYDTAMRHYKEALAIDRKLGNDGDIPVRLFNIGAVYQAKGQYDTAIMNFEEALAIGRKTGRDHYISESLNSIGMVYHSRGQYDSAIKHFEQALVINRKLGREGDIAKILDNIGGVYKAWRQYDKALGNFEQSLAISKKLGREADIANSFNNIGSVYYFSKQYDHAITNLNKSVELKEKLRKTATGNARRDYLASQIKTYQYLIYSYFENNELTKAFAIIELSRAKLLEESLFTSISKSEINIPSVKQIQRNLSKDTAIITYANENLPEKIVIVITKDNIFGVKINEKILIASIKDPEHKKGADTSKIDFPGVINYYRSTLTDLSSQTNRGLKVSQKSLKKKRETQNLNKPLYDFLIKPVAKYIKGKKTLLIIPDGHLGFLPFETLLDDTGNYLVEKYNISYSQSIRVLDLIRKREYKADRKPLLAFGGAVYNKINYSTDMIQTEKHLGYLEKQLVASFQGKRSVRNAYASLDLAEWGNLPGTLSEVNNIKKLVSGASVVTGEKVTENYIKKLSVNGDLAKYKVIHFATHGLVVPEIPALSAIVLSQFKNEQKGEDGYLRMGEIVKLKINADLVALSACETGLGKIYRGEGVVGLTQSFLIAGANGLSVSLWQVADLSTSTFMANMYNIVEKKKVGFDAALNEIKRKFIRGEFGEDFRAPYYWAPFVYYGQFGEYTKQ